MDCVCVFVCGSDVEVPGSDQEEFATDIHSPISLHFICASLNCTLRFGIHKKLLHSKCKNEGLFLFPIPSRSK